MTVGKKWPCIRLDLVCSKIGSGSTPRGGEAVYVDEGTSFIRSQNVYNARFSSDGLVHLTEDQAEHLRGVAIEARDILLNITGDSVARCCQVPEWVLPGRVNQHVAIIRPYAEKLSPEFLLYFFVSPFMQKYLLSRAGSGGTRKALTKSMLANIEVPCPEISEQRYIASTLSAYDDLIATNRRRIALLEASARLLYREWFVHLRFPGHARVPVIDGVPEGWERRSLKQCVSILETGSRPKGGVHRFKDGTPSIGAESIRGAGQFDFATTKFVPDAYFENMRKGVVQDRDVLVYKDGGRPGHFTPHIGIVGEGFPFLKMAINSHVYRVRGFPEISQEFLYYYLSSKGSLNWMTANGTGAAIPSIARKDLLRMPVMVPSNTLMAMFSKMSGVYLTQTFNLALQNKKLVAARDLLLPRLMTGDLAA